MRQKKEVVLSDGRTSYHPLTGQYGPMLAFARRRNAGNLSNVLSSSNHHDNWVLFYKPYLPTLIGAAVSSIRSDRAC